MNMNKLFTQKPITFLALIAAVILLGAAYLVVTRGDSISINERNYDLSDPANKESFDSLVAAHNTLKSGFNFDAAVQRANSFFQLRDTDQAIKAWEYFIKNRPNAIQGYWGLAQIYTLEGNYELAEANWLKAAEVDLLKSYDAHYIGLADLYKTSLPDKRYKIVQIITSALPDHKSPGNLNLILANYYEDTGDIKSAIRFYKEVLKIDPNNTTIINKINELE